MKYGYYLVGIGPLQLAKYIAMEDFAGERMLRMEHRLNMERGDRFTNTVGGVSYGPGTPDGLFARIAYAGN